jgi:hypothetical protein
MLDFVLSFAHLFSFQYFVVVLWLGLSRSVSCVLYVVMCLVYSMLSCVLCTLCCHVSCVLYVVMCLVYSMLSCVLCTHLFSFLYCFVVLWLGLSPFCVLCSQCCHCICIIHPSVFSTVYLERFFFVLYV